jgi:dimethylhistidine N-methyltransferase
MQAFVQVLDVPAETEIFAADVFRGLSRQQKSLPCKYFYDEEGSRLFDAICALEEYYPTRTEIGLLRDFGPDIAQHVGRGVSLIEFGCGSLVKTRLLLDALADAALYVPIDISHEHLLREAAVLNDEYARLEVIPVVADFTRGVSLPAKAAAAGRKRVAFFPGSTVGNFDHAEAARFLGRVARLAGRGGGLLIGVDLKKDEETLVRAYDDSRGVTAAFNLNMLARINRELEGDFDLAAFRHVALYDAGMGRIEIHLESLHAQTARVLGRAFHFRAGETIHTENSYKYSVEEFRALAASAGFRSAKTWVDGKNLFSIHYLAVE